MPKENNGLTKEAIYNRLLYSITRLAPNGLPKHVEALVTKFQSTEITWEAIYALELAQIDLMPEEELRVKLALLREEFRLSAGEREKALVEAKPVDSLSTAELKAQAAALLEELQQQRFSQFKFENARAGTTAVLVASIIVLGDLAIIWHWLTPSEYKIARTLIYTGYCGLVGAGFSYLARLRGLEWGRGFGTRTLSNGLMLQNLLTNMFVSFMTGIIAANALHFIMSIGIVQIGKAVVSGSPDEIYSFGAWSFLAGFAERLVPDKLNQLATLVAEQKASK
jgi:hypothetical protein